MPQRKIKPDDEGPANFWVGSNQKEGIVFLNFDKPVAWVALSPEMAKRLGEDLIKNASVLSKAEPPCRIATN